MQWQSARRCETAELSGISEALIFDHPIRRTVIPYAIVLSARSSFSSVQLLEYAL